MSKINTKPATIVTIILSLGFAATGATSAFAREGWTQMTSRAAVHRHTTHRQTGDGYAGPAYSVVPVRAWTKTKAGFHSIPSQSTTTGDSCDLPSSVCSNDERIND